MDSDASSGTGETSDRRNVTFYEPLGFRTVTDDLALLPGAPAQVAMRRAVDLA